MENNKDNDYAMKDMDIVDEQDLNSLRETSSLTENWKTLSYFVHISIFSLFLKE